MTKKQAIETKNSKGTSQATPPAGSSDRRKVVDTKKSTLVKSDKTAKISKNTKAKTEGNWSILEEHDELKNIKLVTQKEFANIMGVSAAYITKLKSKGVFDICFKNKKLLLDCAKEQLLLNADASRDAQRDAVALKKGNYEQEIMENTPPEVADDEEVFTESNIKQLNKYIRAANTPAQKVQIIKDFWAGKLNEQKYLIEDEKLIPIETVISENQKILKIIRDNFLAMKSKLAPLMLGIEDITEAENILEREVYNILQGLSEMRGCDAI